MRCGPQNTGYTPYRTRPRSTRDRGMKWRLDSISLATSSLAWYHSHGGRLPEFHDLKWRHNRAGWKQALLVFIGAGRNCRRIPLWLRHSDNFRCRHFPARPLRFEPGCDRLRWKQHHYRMLDWNSHRGKRERQTGKEAVADPGRAAIWPLIARYGLGAGIS